MNITDQPTSPTAPRGRLETLAFWAIALGLPVLTFLVLPQWGDAGMNLWLPLFAAAWTLFFLFSKLFPIHFRSLGKASLYSFAGTGFCFLLLTVLPLGELISTPLLLAPASGNADAIFVLASGVGENGQPGFAGYQRTFHGIGLYQQKRAPLIVFSSSGAFDARSGHHESEWVASATTFAGLASDAFIILREGFTTRDEAAVGAALLHPRGIRKILLVTNGPHIRRGVRVFEKAGFEVLPAPVQTAESIRMFSETGVSRFSQAMHEWIGLLLYRIRGDIVAF